LICSLQELLEKKSLIGCAVAAERLLQRKNSQNDFKYKESLKEVSSAIPYDVTLVGDYMANFSPVSPPETSARLPEQIFLKRRLRLHEESFQLGLEISARLNELKNLM